ncbi:N-acetylmuramoyl-L-alanine amidase [Hominibacterium faecale]|uniref:peptidoglycan recognition protein family protein n=1 Tax=Hominibacterium faecale TaxID=2839743 RepID=UPI0022B294E9|nr:N-acetylmuramoyl-L-alanine amidase [Hominibacterium faecale]
MALKVKKKLCPQKKYSRKCPYKMTPSYITIHNTSNDASAANEVAYMLSNNNQTSYHYAVDDKEAVQAIPLNRNAWHAGDGGSGTGNRKSIGIEICYSKSGGSRFDKAEKNAAYLTAVLLKKRGWGISRVKRHKDWSGKNCPHRTISKGWNRFLKMVQAELDKLNKKKKLGKPSVPSKTLVKGNTDAAVETLQELMNWFISKGLIKAVKLALDRSFGPATKKVVKIWQKAAKKKGYYTGRVDGDFGPKSRKAAKAWIADL